MYHFAIVAMLALGTLKFVDFVVDNVSGLERFRSLFTFIVAIGAVVTLDYSLFEGWSIAIQDRDAGMWITGFLVSGMTVPWRAMFAYLTHEKATGDETLGQHSPMRRVA
jgi:hypothetical protein